MSNSHQHEDVESLVLQPLEGIVRLPERETEEQSLRIVGQRTASEGEEHTEPMHIAAFE